MYSRRNWICPYFKWDEKTKIHCECGVLCFCDNNELVDYADSYCSDFKWSGCSLARSRNKYFENQDRRKKKKK